MLTIPIFPGPALGAAAEAAGCAGAEAAPWPKAKVQDRPSARLSVSMWSLNVRDISVLLRVSGTGSGVQCASASRAPRLRVGSRESLSPQACWRQLRPASARAAQLAIEHYMRQSVAG